METVWIKNCLPGVGLTFLKILCRNENKWVEIVIKELNNYEGPPQLCTESIDNCISIKMTE